MLAVYLKTVPEVRSRIAGRFKARRLDLNLTQKELAARSGVTFSSLKRFEREGLIALDSLLNLALVLNCLDDFDKLAAESPLNSATQSLDALLAIPARRRGATGRKGRNHGV
jgi:transcriptional regulator with XRE-family HTH domain